MNNIRLCYPKLSPTEKKLLATFYENTWTMSAFPIQLILVSIENKEYAIINIRFN